MPGDKPGDNGNAIAIANLQEAQTMNGNTITFGAYYDSLVSDAGGYVDRIAYCPHHPDDGCDCRKPAPGLYHQLAQAYGVPLDDVPVVGDSSRDLDAARSVNARPILVLTGNGEQTAADLQQRGDSVETFADLDAAASALIAESSGKAS